MDRLLQNNLSYTFFLLMFMVSNEISHQLDMIKIANKYQKILC